MTVTPDKDALAAHLLNIEARIHAAGWDKPAQLRLIYNHPDTGPTDVLAVPPHMLEGDPGGRLQSMVSLLTAMKGQGSALAASTIEHLREIAPGCYAVVFVSEAYANMDMSDEDAHDYENNPRSAKLIDRPTSKEVRAVGAYDSAGRVYMVNRIRGREPEPVWVTTPFDAEHGTALTGRVPSAMAMLMALLLGEDPVVHAENTKLPEWLRKS